MLKIFKNLTKKDIAMVMICIAFIIFQVWLDLKLPDYMATITRLVQTENGKISDILMNGGYMLLCALLSLLAAIAVGYFASIVSADFSLIVRQLIFNKVLQLDLHSIKHFSTSSLITRTTNDITQIELLISLGLQMLIKAPITAIWAITKILNKSWQWSTLTALSVIILLTTVAILVILVMPRFKLIQTLTDKINAITRENIIGIRVIRSFNGEDFEEQRFDHANKKLTSTQLFNQRSFAIMQPMMYLVLYFLTLGIYYIGACLISLANMNDKFILFADMIVFSSYAMQIIMSFLMLAMIFMILPRAQVSAHRILEVLNAPIMIHQGDQFVENHRKGKVEFKHVYFKYPDAQNYLLEDISFVIHQGETLAIIGPTGSGKSSLIQLIPRLYEVSEGEVLVDDVNVKNYPFEVLNSKLGYVLQKPMIFNGSVEFNVAYGTSTQIQMNQQNITEALEVAQAHEFVEKMPQKDQTILAQGGTNISGGQKQRLSIARAIARKPEIYIFDDSFSALDYQTDSKLRKKLKEYTLDATCIIVAQRIGTIMHADKIMVLDDGKCVGFGSHRELLKNCSLYQEIAYSQLSKEELEHAWS